MYSNTSERRRWLTAYAPLIFWTALILGLGTGMGSMNETSRIIRPLLEFFFPSASPESLTIYHGYIRKFAHFAEYAVLAFLACRAFPGLRFRFVFALLIVALVASIDEINQSFNSARTSSFWDVLLDVGGGTAAILAYWVIGQNRLRGRATAS
jgi:VanZ family protein